MNYEFELIGENKNPDCVYTNDDTILRKIATQKIQEKANDKVWTNKTGNKIHIKDMTTNHIKNTIKMLKNSDDFWEPWIIVFEDELERRGR